MRNGDVAGSQVDPAHVVAEVVGDQGELLRGGDRHPVRVGEPGVGKGDGAGAQVDLAHGVVEGVGDQGEPPPRREPHSQRQSDQSSIEWPWSVWGMQAATARTEAAPASPSLSQVPGEGQPLRLPRCFRVEPSLLVGRNRWCRASRGTGEVVDETGGISTTGLDQGCCRRDGGRGGAPRHARATVRTHRSTPPSPPPLSSGDRVACGLPWWCVRGHHGDTREGGGDRVGGGGYRDGVWVAGSVASTMGRTLSTRCHLKATRPVCFSDCFSRTTDANPETHTRARGARPKA